MINLGPFENLDALVNAAIDLLRRQRYVVIFDDVDFETPRELRTRLGITASYLTKLLYRADCPSFQALRGPTDRILRIKCNPVLEEWLIENQRLTSFYNKAHRPPAVQKP